MDEAKKETREKEEKTEIAQSPPFDLGDEDMDPYVILNSWYRKKGMNIQTTLVDGHLVDVAIWSWKNVSWFASVVYT